jgi:beta-lactam-binding protein with PASTA domain
MVKNRRFSWLLRKRFLLWAGALVALFLLLNYILLPAYVNYGGTLDVPPVIGMTLASAQRVLDSIGMQGIEADTRPDPDRPSGVVINQIPLPGSLVKSGRRIYLTVSGGETAVPVPSLRGRSLRDAKFALQRFGLRLGGVAYLHSESYPENTIVEQSVSPDVPLPRGSVVSVTVSQGKLSQETTVPALIGKTVSEADRLLRSAGLKMGNVTYQPSFELLPNTVVDQFPRAGDPARRGQAVDLFVIKVGRPAEEIGTLPK